MTPSRFLLGLALSCALTGASCSNDPVTPSGSNQSVPGYDMDLQMFTGSVECAWGSTIDDMYAGGNMLLHFDGSTWSPLPLPLLTTGFSQGWRIANGDLVLADRFRIHRFDGTTWDYIATPERETAISGLPTGDIFVSTSRGEVYRYHGGVWDADTLSSDWEIRDVHGVAPDRAYAAGRYGTIARFDGAAWTSVSVDSTLHFERIWGSRDGRVTLMDSNRNLYEYDGVASVTRLDFGVAFECSDLWGDGTGCFVPGYSTSGREIRHFDGTAWRSMPLGTNQSVESGWAAPTGEIFTTGRDGLWKTTAQSSERVLGGQERFEFSDMWTSPEGDVFVVGVGAHRFDGKNWIDLGKQSITSQRGIAISGTNGRNIYVVGNDMILHYDGDAWHWVSGGFQNYLFDVAVWDGEVIAVGDYGMIVRFDGRGWQRSDSPTTRALRAIAGWDGGAVAVGSRGTILRYDGSSWRAETSPVEWELDEVLAFGPDRIVAAGENPWQVVVYDGRSWSTRPVESYTSSGGFAGGVTSLWGTSPENFFMGNYRGGIEHFDRGSWSTLPRAMASSLQALTGTPDGTLFVASYEALLRYVPR